MNYKFGETLQGSVKKKFPSSLFLWDLPLPQ